MKEGWENVTLESVCQKTSNIKWATQSGNSFKYIDLSSVSRDDLAITQTSVVNSDNAPSRAKKIVLKDDVIFATTRPTLKRVTIIDEEYDNQICSTGYAVLRPIKNKIDSRFIYYFILSEGFMNRMENLQRGASYPAVTDKDVKKTSIWIPKSLTEQKQIVTLLDSAFAKIDQAKANIEKNIANAQELFQSKLNTIFSQKGDGWEERRLGEVCLKITDGAHHSPKVLYSEKAPGLYPYVTSKNIRNNYMDFSKLQYVDSSFHDPNFLRCTPELGDVLLTKDGANTGNITINTLDEPFSLLSSVALIKPDKKKLNPSFLKFYIQSPIGFKSITGKMTGAAIKRIILRSIKSAEINLPDIDMQNDYVLNIEKLLLETDGITNTYSKKLQNLEDLKKSLLQKAFAGELT